MRRALSLAGVFFVGLLVAVPSLTAGAEREVERDLQFTLEAEGFTVWGIVSNNDGEVSALIMVARGPLTAYYAVPAKVTADRVTARFGSLGELDYRFTPKQGGRAECTGSETGDAVFEGTFKFTGENGYVHVDAPRAEGSFQVYPEPKTCAPQGVAGRVVPRRVVPYSPSYSDRGATLSATAASRAKGTIRDLSIFDDGRRGSRKAAVFSHLAEHREGMTVSRGVQMGVGANAFRWNLEQGTATLRPPAPFTGSARFSQRRSGRRGTWRGSLVMPILGGEPVRMAGRGFRAFMHRGVPQSR